MIFHRACARGKHLKCVCGAQLFPLGDTPTRNAPDLRENMQFVLLTVFACYVLIYLMAAHSLARQPMRFADVYNITVAKIYRFSVHDQSVVSRSGRLPGYNHRQCHCQILHGARRVVDPSEKKLSYSATGFEHLHIQDIIAQQQHTARNCVQDLFAKTTKQCPEPEGTGITFEQGVVYETLVCGIVNYTFDAAKVAEYCLQLKTDRIGVVVDLCRSVGGFKKDFGANREPLVGDAGAVVSVGIVFLQARNGVVCIADPPITRACCIL